MADSKEQKIRLRAVSVAAIFSTFSGPLFPRQ